MKRILLGILGVRADGYTYTQMVAEGGQDLWKPRRCGLSELAVLQAPVSTDRSHNDNPASDNIHCDITNSARSASHRSRVLSKGLSATWATHSPFIARKGSDAFPNFKPFSTSAHNELDIHCGTNACTHDVSPRSRLTDSIKGGSTTPHTHSLRESVACAT